MNAADADIFAGFRTIISRCFFPGPEEKPADHEKEIASLQENMLIVIPAAVMLLSIMLWGEHNENTDH